MTSLRDLRLLFFCGKGGTGKTTAAAATAIALARHRPARRVLLLSVDPAHSLADVMRMPVGDDPTPVDRSLPNLHVRELNAAAALAARRASIETALDDLAASVGALAAVPAGSRGLHELLKLAPPGIDELLGLVSLLEALDAPGLVEESSSDRQRRTARPGRRYDMVIVDAAPTGHALRLLEMPDVVRDWIRVLLRLQLKYKELARPGQLAAALLELSKSIGAMTRLLRTPTLASFVVVTRAGEVPRKETERLLKQLKRFGVSVPFALINALTLTPGRCARCRAIAAVEARQRVRISRACRRSFGECGIIQTPLVAPPPRGVEALDDWARRWM